MSHVNIGGMTNLVRIKVKKFEKSKLSSKLLPNDKNDDRTMSSCSHDSKSLVPSPKLGSHGNPHGQFL